MSYNHPYQSYQPSAFPPPPPPPPRQSSGSCYASAQTPTLPPRPSPTPGSPNVQDLTAGFTRLSTHGQPSTSQPYVPHAEYYQATSSYTWPTDHGASMSAASQAKYETPPPLPPRPSSQSPWQGSWQAPHSPPPPSYTPQQTWQQPPQSPWTAPSNQPSPQTPSPQWQQTGTYNRPPPPPPAELHSSYQSTCQCAWGQQCYVHPKQPADSSPQGTLTATPVQSPYQQDSYKKPSYQQTYYPPPQSNVPELASESPSYAQRIPQPISSPQSVQPESNQPPATHQPQPPQFVFEMEGSTPGMPEQKHLSEERKKVEPTREPVPEKLQRTFTDTLRQAGPYFYTPPVQAAVQEETSSGKEPSGVNAEPTEPSPNATPDLGVRPESEARPPPHANASRCQDSTSHGGKETPLAGAVPRCYYLKIPNPPANIPTEQPGGYFVPYKCEYPQVNTYADVFWFNHIDVPDFRICGFCFETRIRQTAFASSFTGRMESKNLKLRCSFGAPRMADALWPQALQTGDLERVKGYMERRVQITNCHGVGGVLGKDASGVRWFAMRGNEIPGFISCEACLEENVIGTSFQDRFVPYSQPQGPDERWACDLAIEYLRHGLSHALEASDWNAFVSMASHRVSIPACEGTNGVLAGSRKWYKPANNIPGVVICETCYVDQFGFTPFERNFVENPVQKEIANNQWSCDIAPISVKNAIEAAKQNSDFTPIQTTLSSLASNPICSAGAIASKTWYNLANNATNFDVCETCYIGLFSCLGLSHLFRAATTPQATTRICDLSLHSPRFKEYAFLYLAVINTPTGESTFLSHVSRFANIPSCSRRDPARNRRWHLLNGLAADLVVCEECHADFTEPTSLAHLLTLWPPSPTDSDPIPRVCDMYSPNMRARWSQLCAATAHDPSSSAPLDAFVAFSQHRHRVYEETMPRCRELLQVAKMRSQQHEVAGAMSSHYHSMALMTGGYGGYGWSGGHGGLYGGQAAAAGAQGVQLMMEMQADVRKVAILEGRWEAVE